MKKFFNIDYYLFLVFILIYAGSNTVFSQVVISTQRTIVLTAVFLLFLSFMKFRYRIQKNAVKILVALEALIVISLLINSDLDGFRGCMIIAIKILNGFLLFTCFDKRRVLAAYCRVMYLIAIASLVITFLFPLLSIHKLFPVLVNSMGVRFYNCLLSVKIDSYGLFALRNYGIFSEPAVYCYYLFLAAMLTYFLDRGNGKRYLRVLLLCVTMLTTFSPVGILCGILLGLIVIVEAMRKKTVSSGMKLGLVAAVIIVLGIVLFNGEIQRQTLAALSKLNFSGGSGEGRLRAIWLSFVTALRRPFFGGSMKTNSAIVNMLGYNTSTTGTMMVAFGVFFTGIVTVLQYKSVKTITEGAGMFMTVLFFTLYLIMINDYGLIQGDWYWYFAFIGICGGRLYESTVDDFQRTVPGP